MPEMQFPEPCILHMSNNDEDCEACTAEHRAIAEQTLAANKETVKIVSQLEVQGFEVDTLVHTETKLTTLIDSLFGKNLKARAKFDCAVATNVLNEMVRLQAEAVRESLLS